MITSLQHPGTTVPTSDRFGHFSQLDGLRGLSIILVLVGHTAEFSLCVHTCSFMELGQFASLGVLLFFALSGFLITGLLLSEENVSGYISLRQFYMRRVLRIMPAFYTMLVIVGILMLMKLVTDVPWYTLPLTALYLRDIAGRGQTLGHTWSLSIEEQFYLAWPLLLACMVKRRAILLVLPMCLVAPVWRATAVYTGTSAPWHYSRPYYWCDCILSGCVIALAWTYRKRYLEVIGGRINSYVLFSVLLSWTLVAGSVPAFEPFYRTVQVLLAALILTNLVTSVNSHFAKLLSSTALCWCGKVSYSVYLWQQLFIVTKLPSWGPLRAFPIDVICAISLGVLSYTFIERPFLKLKGRWAGVPDRLNYASAVRLST